MISCRECGVEARFEEAVCLRCGGFLVGSRDRTLGVFSLNRHLDKPRVSSLSGVAVLDLDADVLRTCDAPSVCEEPTMSLGPQAGDRHSSEQRSGDHQSGDRQSGDTVTVVASRCVELDPGPGVGDPLEVEPVLDLEDLNPAPVVVAGSSAWPIIKAALTAVGYLLFVIAVAIVVNKVLRAL